MGHSHHQLHYFSSRRHHLWVAQEAVSFLPTQILSRVLIWFDSNPFVIWDSYRMLHSHQAEQGPRSAPHHTQHRFFWHKRHAQTHKDTHTAIFGLKSVISMKYHLYIEDLVLRKSTKRNKCKLWNPVDCVGAQLHTRPSCKWGDDEIVPQILTSLAVKQEASLDTQKEPDQLSEWFFILNTQTHLCISEQKLPVALPY